MKRCIVVLAAVGVLVLSFVAVVFALDLVWQDIGSGNLNLKTVVVESDNPQIIYVGSRQGVFKSEDGGGNWRNILSLRGTNKEINFLLFALGDKNSLYAATGKGLYFSSNQGRGWRRIFRGKSPLENECVTLAALPEVIYLGTKAGLFVSRDKGRSWYKETGKLGASCILAIAYNLKEPNFVYVVSVDGVFMTMDTGQSWERIFASHPIEDSNDNDTEEVTEDQDEEARNSNIRYVAGDPNNLNYLYLATSGGVYKSQDRGKSWELLPADGLLEKEVKFLLVSPESVLYALTKTGVYTHKDGRWQDLSLGLPAQDISSLYLDKQANLYTTCDRGLFKASIVDSSNSKDTAISLYYKDEPQIKAVQLAAIKYAEVEPEKIRDWRKKAKMKAILPKLTVGLDRSESTNYEIYTSATTRYVYDGPDDESHGWDLTLSWDLSELIWNLDQTSIDVRSRLMEQLRPLNVHIWSLS